MNRLEQIVNILSMRIRYQNQLITRGGWVQELVQVPSMYPAADLKIFCQIIERSSTANQSLDISMREARVN